MVLLAGCSDQAPTMTPESPAPPGPGEATPSATPAAPTLVGKVGDTYVGNQIDATVEQFNPKVTTSALSQTWQAVLVKTCAKADDVIVSTYSWQAITADSGRYHSASSHYHDAPKPLYAVGDEQVLNGECVRGWILFDSPADVEAVEIRYAPEGEGPTRWML